MFDAQKVKDQIVKWIRDWFEVNGKDCKAIVGISGGKDSTIVAALCAEALGKDKVIGVIMPNTNQSCEDALAVIEYLGINQLKIDIGTAYSAIYHTTNHAKLISSNNCCELKLTEQAEINLAPRLRMATLYFVSQCVHGRVANTCNMSENYVGWNTHFGDDCGDFSPLSNLTVTEVKSIGYELGLPTEFVDKVPDDGLCGATDEEKFGFTYEVLDKYIRTGICEDEFTKDRIDKMHYKNLFKMQPMESFPYKV